VSRSTDFTQSLQLAAKHTLTKIPTTQKKDYISAGTWKVIEEKEAAIAAGDYARSQVLSSTIKRMARKDRKNMILEQLQAADAQGYKWGRRMDISERTGTNLTITLLDWKMAFDKVDQHKITAGIEKHLQQTQAVLDQSARLHFMANSCKFEVFIQSFGVSFYMGWKLANLTSHNFID